MTTSAPSDTAIMQGTGLGRAPLRPFLSWPLLIALAALARPLSDRLALLNDPDTYLHIAAGRWMLAHGSLPFHDPFSHAVAGATWVPHEWLAELILALAYDWLGWPAVVLLAALCFAAAMALLTRRLLQHFEPFSALILVGASAALLFPHLLARPHVLAFPLLVAWSDGLIAARDRDEAPSLWLLPAMALWANLHGSFMFGLALALFLGIEAIVAAPSSSARRAAFRRWGGFTVLAVAAALCTPNLLDGLLLPLRIAGMTVLQQSFTEWMSPNFQRFDPLELWLLGATALGFALGARLPAMRLVLLLGLFHVALQHLRHADLVAFVAPLAVARSLGPAIVARIHATPPSALGQWFAALARPAGKGGIALALALVVAISAATLLRPLPRPDGPETPGAALAAASRFALSGAVLNSELFGGFLIFNGVPTFIDGRIELYGDAFLRRYLDAVAGNEAELTGILAQYRIAWTMLQPQDRAVEVLDHLPGWQRVYSDRYTVIHARRTVLAR